MGNRRLGRGGAEVATRPLLPCGDLRLDHAQTRRHPALQGRTIPWRTLQLLHGGSHAQQPDASPARPGRRRRRRVAQAHRERRSRIAAQSCAACHRARSERRSRPANRDRDANAAERRPKAAYDRHAAVRRTVRRPSHRVLHVRPRIPHQRVESRIGGPVPDSAVHGCGPSGMGCLSVEVQEALGKKPP